MKSMKLPQLIGGDFRGRHAAEFLPLFAQLREAGLKLEQASANLEQQFLAAGTELEALSGLGTRFVKQVEQLVNLATGRDCDHSAFSNAIALIGQSTQFLAGCQEETGRMLGLLRSYQEQIEPLLRIEAELQRTMMPLKYVQTLFKSEAAVLGPEVQLMFGSLTQEIEGLHNQVREIFGTQFKQLDQSRRVIDQVIVQLEAQARLLEKVTTVHKAQIEATLGTLKSELAINAERDVRLSRVSRDLANEVGQAVIGLQFQDIVSQKLQHVTGALKQIEAKFTEMQAAPKEAALGSLQFLNQSCRLEAGQVLAAQAELKKAEATVRDSVQKALSHLTEVDSRCLSLEEFKLLTTSFDGMVQTLLDTIEEVRRLMAGTVAGAADAYELLRPLDGLASDLTTVVRDLSSRIHLIGLNAQVQAALAARDRRGAGLEVLSVRTSQISDEINRISGQAALKLDALVGGLAESVKTLERLRANGQARQRVVNEQGEAEEQRLHAFRDRALAMLNEMGNSLNDIRAQGERALAAIAFAEFYELILPTLQLPLMAIAELAERRLQTRGRGEAPTSMVEGFKREYTMASEHSVFAGVIAGDVHPPGHAEPDAATPMIELFTDPPTAAAGEPSLMPAAKAEPAAVIAPAPAATAASDDLGANIEMF